MLEGWGGGVMECWSDAFGVASWERMAGEREIWGMVHLVFQFFRT
jgi:hypothetical protein